MHLTHDSASYETYAFEGGPGGIGVKRLASARVVVETLAEFGGWQSGSIVLTSPSIRTLPSPESYILITARSVVWAFPDNLYGGPAFQ